MSESKLELIDALCILQRGWHDDSERALYCEADDLVRTHARRIHLQRQLVALDSNHEEHNDPSK